MGLGIADIIGDKREQILQLAQQYGVQDVRIFGSVVRGEATEDSDVDLLVNMSNSTYFKVFDLQEDLSKLLHKKVDIVSDRGLDKYIGPYILKEATKL